MRSSSFCGRDPMALGPGWIVPDVLVMPTLKFSDPIQILILVEANDLSRQTLRLALRFHVILPG